MDLESPPDFAERSTVINRSVYDRLGRKDRVRWADCGLTIGTSCAVKRYSWRRQMTSSFLGSYLPSLPRMELRIAASFWFIV